MSLAFSFRGTALSAAILLGMGAALAGCSFTGEAPGLAPGLVARMDQPGASLDRAQALGLINQYRASIGVAAISEDSALDAAAQSAAASYAASGQAPALPSGAVAMRASAGYPTFAETFSGWRNSPADAQVLADSSARRAGIGVVYDGGSGYGVYWVLLLG